MASDIEAELRASLHDAYDAITSAGIDTLVVGGLALTYHLEGEPQIDHDIDLLIAENDVEAGMKALADAGFEVTETHPTWLFKGRRNGTTVDVLYRLGRSFTLDAEMMARAPDVPMDGVAMRFIGREDLAAGQAGAAKPEVPSLWFQAIDLLRADDVDWEYLADRMGVKPHLRAGLLGHARHLKIAVPDRVLG